jgi:putative peptidoglycan lipid II flippase
VDAQNRKTDDTASEERRVVRSAGVLGATTLLSRVLGLVREVVFASVFGVTWITDAFRVAYVIPYILRRLLGEGSMSAFLVPVLTDEMERGGKPAAFRAVRAAYTLFFIVTVVIVVILVGGAPYVVLVIAPGFKLNPETFELAVNLARIMLPYMLLMMTSAMAMGILNSFFKFTVPALSPTVMNVCYLTALGIIIAFFAATPDEHKIYVLAIGVLAGGVGSILLQTPSLWRLGFRYVPRFDFANPAVKQIAVLMTPALFSIGIVRLNLLIATAAASIVGVGTVSLINYAERLLQFPLGVFGFSISNVILPQLSRQASKGDKEGLKDSLSFALRLALLVGIPCTVGLIVLGEPLVRLVYERGAFTAEDTAGASFILIGFSVFLIGFLGAQIVTPVFYALKKPREPIKAGVVTFVVNLVLTLILMWPLGGAGIALATSASATIGTFFLLYRFRKLVGPIGARRVIRAGARFATASIVMAIPITAIRLFIELYPGDLNPWLEGAAAVTGVAIAVPIYFAAARLLGSPEVGVFLSILSRKKDELPAA